MILFCGALWLYITLCSSISPICSSVASFVVVLCGFFVMKNGIAAPSQNGPRVDRWKPDFWQSGYSSCFGTRKRQQCHRDDTPACELGPPTGRPPSCARVDLSCVARDREGMSPRCQSGPFACVRTRLGRHLAWSRVLRLGCTKYYWFPPGKEGFLVGQRRQSAKIARCVVAFVALVAWWLLVWKASGLSLK